MNYRVHDHGQDLGVFTLEELRRRRTSGELKGSEWVLAEGASEWKALDSVLETVTGALRSSPPPLPPSATKKESNHIMVLAIAGSVVLFVAGVIVVGIQTYRLVKRVQTTMNDEGAGEGVALASQPIIQNTNTPTEADLQKKHKAFRIRQWLDGYKERGPHDRPWDKDAIQLIESWIAHNYGGESQTNLASPQELSDKLVAAGCKDPLVLTVAGVNSIELGETTRRLEQAVSGFEKSNYKAYPKFYAAATLAGKLGNKSQRVPALDASAVQLLKEAFKDGSVLPEDQDELAEILVLGWGNGFFERNQAAVVPIVKHAGRSFEWLSLNLEGEFHINEAWRARGGGYADTVSQQGWKGFQDHLVEARNYLTQAWKLRPDLPLPASRMITVAMGDSDAEEMRLWFDRATTAQIDHPQAWVNFKWGLRPRWHGSHEAMIALGVSAVDTGRFDTDVPRKFFDVIKDLESDLELPLGEHIYGREDIWPHFQKMYEGYIVAPSQSPGRDGWMSSYAVVAYLAGNYDVAQEQLEAIHWTPRPASLKDWGVDLSAMPLEVAARTGALSSQVDKAESARNHGGISRALQLYSQLAARTNIDERTRKFVRLQTALLELEQRLQKGEWVDFLPARENDENWVVSWGNPVRTAADALEIRSRQDGHLLYSRARVGEDFEAKGEFEVVSSSNKDFQAGLVMGMPVCDTRFNSLAWFAFRLKRNATEGDSVSFSKGWTRTQVHRSIKLNDDRNSFQFRLENGKATASVNGTEILRNAAPPNTEYSGKIFLVGVGAFNDSNETVIRYRNLQVRRISTESKPAEN